VACLTQRNSEEAKIRLWDRSGTQRGEWLTGLRDFRQASTIAFTPDGLLVLAGNFYDKSPEADQKHRHVYARLQFFDAEKSVADTPVSTLHLPDCDTPDTLQFSSDGAYALLHTNLIQRLYLVERSTGKVMWKAEDQRGAVFSHDGKTVFCRPLGSLIVARDTLSGTVLWQRDSHVGTRKENDITADKTAWVSISPDGKTLAGKGDDGTVRFWNAADGHLVQSLLIMPTTPQQNYSPEWIAWKPDGRFPCVQRCFAFPPLARGQPDFCDTTSNQIIRTGSRMWWISLMATPVTACYAESPRAT
jgi:WD40 repeat protein